MKPVYVPMELNPLRYHRIWGRAAFLFVPLCGNNFSSGGVWKMTMGMQALSGLGLVYINFDLLPLHFEMGRWILRN